MELKAITVVEKGAVPRRLQPAHTRASRVAYYVIGREFHEKMMPKRFTVAHGLEAGYRKRKGEEAGTDTKAFFKSYTGRKVKIKGHRKPLVWSGETEKRARSVNLVVTPQLARLKYNLPQLNRRPWMNDEIRRILPREIAELSKVWKQAYDDAFARESTQTTTTI